MARARSYPTARFPNQLVVQISDETLERIEADALAREDRNRSAATRRLIDLGKLLADALALHGVEKVVEHPDNVLDDLLDAAEAVS